LFGGNSKAEARKYNAEKELLEEELSSDEIL